MRVYLVPFYEPMPTSHHSILKSKYTSNWNSFQSQNVTESQIKTKPNSTRLTVANKQINTETPISSQNQNQNEP